MELNGVIDRNARLLSLATALADASTTEHVADVVLEQGLGAVTAEHGLFACVTGPRLTMIAARGYDENLRPLVMQLNETSPVPLADAARSAQPVWLETPDDFSARYPTAFDSFAALSGTQAHVAVPLIYRGLVVGCIGFCFSKPTSFAAVDRAFTLLLCHLVAAALHRARSYDADFECRQRVERVAAARADVLGIVAHDLRNPLSLIDTTAQFLMEDDPPLERRRELLAATRRAAARMERLVGDLLDAVRMQSGRLRVDVREVDVRSILRAADEGYRTLAEKHGIGLCVETIDTPLCARCDESRIVQAVGNLLGNALKFTGAGGRVSVFVTAGADEITFNVTDTGPGIPESEVEHVFERFWQARSGVRSGVGLGLAIVKGIVDAHGGRVWITSAVGAGTTFSFTLPRCCSMAQPQPRLEESTPQKPAAA